MAKQVTGTAKNLHYAYSFGAAIVIIGALFKINHIQFGFITGGVVLGLGLGVEAFIFVLAALFDVPKEEYQWEKAYPELEGGVAKTKSAQVDIDKKMEAALSAKLDNLLAEAKIDVQLFNNLKVGLDNFASNIADMNKVTDAVKSTQAYADQLNTAASHIESLNALYNIQLEHGKHQADLSKNLIENLKGVNSGSEALVNDMTSLSSNMKDLSKVYGGMLSAMRTKD